MKFYWKKVTKFLFWSLFFVDAEVSNSLAAASSEDLPVEKSVVTSPLCPEESYHLAQARIRSLLEKANGDPQKVFNDLALDLDIGILRLREDFITVLRLHGESLDPKTIFYRLGVFLQKVERNSDYQPLIDQMKDWIANHYTQETFKEAKNTIHGMGISQAYKVLQQKWPEFCGPAEIIPVPAQVAIWSPQAPAIPFSYSWGKSARKEIFKKHSVSSFQDLFDKAFTLNDIAALLEFSMYTHLSDCYFFKEIEVGEKTLRECQKQAKEILNEIASPEVKAFIASHCDAQSDTGH
jgi:hypothetical protein